MLVRGTQGSGKTTLAAALGKRLGWPVVSREAFRDAVQATLSADLEPRGPVARRAVEDFHLALTAAAGRDESLIADSTSPSGVCEEDLSRLGQHADLMSILCVVPREVAIGRCAARTGSGTLLAVLKARDEVLWARFEQPLQCDIPQLEVATTDGYQPTLDDMIEWVVSG